MLFGETIVVYYENHTDHSPGSVRNFLFSTSSRAVMGHSQPLIQWVLRAVSSGGKAAGA
jgi:hypothetical protein